MRTGPPSNPIRLSIVGNNELKFAYDYIRFFLVLVRVLELRKEKPDGSMFDVAAGFADRFEHLDHRW